MDLQALKEHLRAVMPILDANLAVAYTEYMNGDIPAGAYGYVRVRHEAAHAVLTRDDLEPDFAFKACALLAMDLRTGLQEMGADSDAGVKVEAWWQCYRDAGYTALHEVFATPMRPEDREACDSPTVTAPA